MKIVNYNMADNYWCNCQIEAREDVGKPTYTCGAHLAEGRAFQCRRKPSEVYIDSRSLHLHHGLRLPDDPDFEPARGRIQELRGLAKKAGRIR